MAGKKLSLKTLEGTFCIVRLATDDPIPPWINTDTFFSVTRTDEELSIVCLQQDIPAGLLCEKDYEILKVEGPLDFSLTGIISGISTVLAQNGISLFTLSTYDTDYILIKSKDRVSSKNALIHAGYEIT